MKTTSEFISMTDRYTFDFGRCSYERGFCQVDTSQDAWFFGRWANPYRLVAVAYTEGDLDVFQCDTAEEFTGLLRGWNDTEQRYTGRHIRIDLGLTQRDAMRAKFDALGLADLLH